MPNLRIINELTTLNAESYLEIGAMLVGYNLHGSQ